MYFLDVILPLVGLLVVLAGLWFASCLIVNRWAGTRRRLRVATGPILRTSSWGSADVNGVGFMESVRVVECRDGWLVQLHWLLGGGKLWLPRQQTRLSQSDRSERAFIDNAVLEAGAARVQLEGELAEFVAEPPPARARP